MADTNWTNYMDDPPSKSGGYLVCVQSPDKSRPSLFVAEYIDSCSYPGDNFWVFANGEILVGVTHYTDRPSLPECYHKAAKALLEEQRSMVRKDEIPETVLDSVARWLE